MVCYNITRNITANDSCSYKSGDNLNDSTSTYYENKWLQDNFNKAQYIICPLLFVVGITGNLLTILTVTKPQFRQLTSRYILCALAISDSLLLWTNPFNQQFMQALFGRDIRALSITGCKVFFVAYRTGKMSSSWCIVLIAVERFVAVWFPLKVKSIITKKYISLALLCVYISMATLSSLWTFATNVVNGICLPDSVTPETLPMHKRFVLAGAVCYSVAPILLLLTLTPPVIIRLVRQQHRRKSLHSNATSRFARETNRTTVMLVAVVVSYMIAVTPITLVLILTFWTNEPVFGSHKKEFIILTSVAQSLEQINHSMNFIIYTMFSRQFRMGFLQMIKCGRQPAASPHTSSAQVHSSQSCYDEISANGVISSVSGNINN